MPEEYKPSTVRARSSIKSLNFELSNLTPSALVTFFEIDISDLLKTQGIIPTLSEDAKIVGFNPRADVNDGILRFHTNIKIFNSYVVWQGKTYYPAPIQAEGFEANSKGTLPQPTLTIASQSTTGSDQLALLRYEIKKFGDIINSKVTRRRTFAKYLDKTNFVNPYASLSEKGQQVPEGYEPDPYAELPKDVYFIERKQKENKTVLTYLLSSVLDLEGVQIPKRVIVADKCVWQYRGIGCWYQHQEDDETIAPLLEKAELNFLSRPDGSTEPSTTSQESGLPTESPPVATENDEKIGSFVSKALSDAGKWDKEPSYEEGQCVYLLKDKVKYYFVSTGPVKNSEGEVIGGDDTPTFPNKDKIPPNKEYWVADQCSKSLTGCRMRWGLNGPFKQGIALNGCKIKAGELPFGGFPAARKIARGG